MQIIHEKFGCHLGYFTNMSASTTDSCLSFLRHNHSDHGSSWTFQGSTLPVICFTCCIESLEDPEELMIRKRKMLSEILNLLSQGHFIELVLSQLEVMSHFLNVVLNFMNTENEITSTLATECIVQTIFKLKNEELVRQVFGKVTMWIINALNLRKSFPVINLLGQMIKVVPAMIPELSGSHDLIEHLLNSLSFPDENIKCCIIYFFYSMFKIRLDINSFTETFFVALCSFICEILCSCQSKDLKINSLALLKILLTNAKTSKVLFPSDQINQSTSSFIQAMKKSLLNSEIIIQVSSLQCLSEILLQSGSLPLVSVKIIESGLPEFIYEILTMSDISDTLLTSAFQCLNHMMANSMFFSKGHAVYGIEALISAVSKSQRLNNPEVIQLGFALLTKVFEGQSQTPSLFSNVSLVKDCLKLYEESFTSLDYGVLKLSQQALNTMIGQNHIPSFTPYQSLKATLTPLMENFQKYSAPKNNFKHMKKETFLNLVETGFSIVNNLCELVYQHKLNPSYELLLIGTQSTDSSQVSPEMSLQQFTRFLLQSIDSIFTPLILFNIEFINSPKLFLQFFQLLNNQFVLLEEKCSVLASKLAGTSFITHSLRIKAKYSTNKDTLGKTIDRFLIVLSGYLSQDGDKSFVTTLMESTMQHIHGSPRDLLTLLKQTAITDQQITDKTLHDIHCAVLTLIYLAQQQGEPLIPDSQFACILSDFISLHYEVGLLPEVVFKYLLHLFIKLLHVTVYSNGSVGESLQCDFVQCSKILGEALSHYDLVKVYLHWVPFIEWCFSETGVSLENRMKVLRTWFYKGFLEETNKDPTQINELLSLLRTNTSCLMAVIMLLTNPCEHSLIDGILTILDMLFDNRKENGKHLKFTKETEIQLLSSLQKILLKHKINPLPDHNLTAIIKLLGLVYQHTGCHGNYENVLKVIHHVVSFLRDNICTETLIQCLNLLNILMAWITEQSLPQLAAFILSNTALIESLKGLLENKEKNTTCHALVLINMANMMNCEHKFGTKACQSLDINVKSFIWLLNDYTQPLIQLAALIFWSALLLRHCQSSLICINTAIQTDITTSLPEMEWHVLYIYLQHALVHENRVIQQVGASCVKRFFGFVSNPVKFVNHPWNHAVLHHYLTKEELNVAEINFVRTLMSYIDKTCSSHSNILKGLVDVVIKTLGHCGSTEDSLFWECVNLVTELAYRFTLTSRQKVELNSVLNERNLPNEDSEMADDEHAIIFYCLDGVIVQAPLVKHVVEKKKECLEHLIKEIKNCED